MSERLTSSVTARVSRLSAASFNTIFFQMFVIKNVHTIYRTWVSNYNHWL